MRFRPWRFWNGRFAGAREMGYAGAMASTEAPPTGLREGAQPRRAKPPAFPGCKPFACRAPRSNDFEGRLEYWDAATETAWICEPTTPYHERPSRLLTRLAGQIAGVRGSPIECYGSMDLLLRDSDGRRGASCRRTSRCTCIRRGPDRGPRRWWWARMTFPTWCWRWITPRTRAGASLSCTSRGDFRKCGSRCRRRRRRVGRAGGGRD